MLQLWVSILAEVSMFRKFCLSIVLLLGLVGVAYGQDTPKTEGSANQEWLLVLKSSGRVTDGEKQKIRIAIKEKWFQDITYQEVDPAAFMKNLEKYEGKYVATAEFASTYGFFEFSIRTGMIQKKGTEINEISFPKGPHANIQRQSSLERLLKEIRFLSESKKHVSFMIKGPRLVSLLGQSVYRITLNPMGESLQQARITCELPPQLEYVSSSHPCIFRYPVKDRPGELSWDLADVDPWGELTVRLTLRAKATGIVRITSRLTASRAMPLMASTATKIIGCPAMHINSYDTEDPCEVGKETIYVVEARNEGTSPCTNVKLENKIPKQMEYVRAEGPCKFQVESGVVRFEAVPILQPGEKLTYRIVCKAIKEGSAKNTAILSYDQFDRQILDEEGTSIYK
jgi:uncharacterized repeat protein (TIGR01451 family)